MSVIIAGTGSFLPERIVTNADLEKMVETSDEWITSRTGIKQRRIASAGETVSRMGTAAAAAALGKAGISASEVGLIIAATVTPDMAFPSVACMVQAGIGAGKAFCYDLSAACSGFLYAVETARRFIESGSVTAAVVIGAEKFSDIVNWRDRDTCVLFGDGAGAVVLKASDRGRGIMSMALASDGTVGEVLRITMKEAADFTGAVSARKPVIEMNGREVFKHAVRCMCESSEQALERCGLKGGDIDIVIPHQANERILTALVDRLGIPMERVFINLDKVGNISAASVPVAMDAAVSAGLLRRGHKVLVAVAGAGFTWGSAVIEW